MEHTEYVTQYATNNFCLQISVRIVCGLFAVKLTASYSESPEITYPAHIFRFDGENEYNLRYGLKWDDDDNYHYPVWHTAEKKFETRKEARGWIDSVFLHITELQNRLDEMRGDLESWGD